MTVVARTFPREIRDFFTQAGLWDGMTPEAQTILQGLGVKLEPFGVPLEASPDRNDIRGFEMLAYGAGGTCYGAIIGPARKAKLSDGILGVALFKVALLTALALVQEMGGKISGRVWEKLCFSINVDAAMLALPIFAELLKHTPRPPFQLLLEASENLLPEHAAPLRVLLDRHEKWLGLALDDSDELAYDTRTLLTPRVRLVKADGKYVRKLYRDRERGPNFMLSRLLELRQDRVPFVAEGVETEDIKAYLQQRWDVSAHGELWMQGYHIQVSGPWSTVLQPVGNAVSRPEAYVLPEPITIIGGKLEEVEVPHRDAEPWANDALKKNLMNVLRHRKVLQERLAIHCSSLPKDAEMLNRAVEALASVGIYDAIERVLVSVTDELIAEAGGWGTDAAVKVFQEAALVFNLICASAAAAGKSVSEGEVGAGNEAAGKALPVLLSAGSLCTVEAHIAGGAGRPTFLQYQVKRGKPSIRNPEAIVAHEEAGWGMDFPLERLLLRIWHLVKPAAGRQPKPDGSMPKDDELLSADEINKHLRSELASLLNTRRTRRLHYLALDSALKDEPPGLLDALADVLPEFTIVRFRSPQGDVALAVDSEERFVSAITRFLELAHPKQS